MKQSINVTFEERVQFDNELKALDIIVQVLQHYELNHVESERVLQYVLNRVQTESVANP